VNEESGNKCETIYSKERKRGRSSEITNEVTGGLKSLEKLKDRKATEKSRK
jgi:hypothetical protein